MEILHTSSIGRFMHKVIIMVANECRKCVHFELKEDEYSEYGYCNFCDDLINLDYDGNCNCTFYHR